MDAYDSARVPGAPPRLADGAAEANRFGAEGAHLG